MFFIYFVFVFFYYSHCHSSEESKLEEVRSAAAAEEVPSVHSLFRNNDSEEETSDDLPFSTKIPPTDLSFSRVPLQFRIGFEFQEGNHLCPWAFNNYQYQKTPIFYVTHGERTLWSLVIDGMDLEFVTNHFANHERQLIEHCIGTIEEACRTLRQLFVGRKKEGMSIDTLTFGHWLTGEVVFIEQNYVKRAGLFDKFGCDVETTDLYWYLKDHFFSFGAFEDIKFQPQMTLQLPIERIIPVLFYLYGTIEFSYTSEISEALLILADKAPPEMLKDILTILENMQFDDESTFLTNFPEVISKEHSFLFVFLLHIQQLTKQINLEETENQRLFSLYQDYTRYYQVNAKRDLTLLSRRPFSVIWRDIVTSASNSLSIEDSTQPNYFQELAADLINEKYFAILSDKMQLINYGKRYRRADGSSLDLSFLDRNFQPNTLEKWFIDKGIVTTSLLSKSGLNNFKNYLGDIISSIDDPRGVIRPYIDINDVSEPIKSESAKYDLLSPPIFLPDTDSMGAFKDQTIDLVYGEGIFEFRSIRYIGQGAINRVKEKLSQINGDNEDNPKFYFSDFLGFIKDDCNDTISLLSSVKGLCSVLEDIICTGKLK